MKLRGYVANVYQALRGFEAKVTDASDLTWTTLLGQPGSKAGVAVNIDTALRVSTVFACCRVLAEGVAQLPLKIFRQVGNSKKPATDLAIYNLLAQQPNDFMTSFELRETMMYHAVLGGNSFSYLGRGGTKREIQEIIPLVSPVRVEQDKQHNVTYWVASADGGEVDYTPAEILHLRGPSWNGYLGMDAVRIARESIGLSIATEETHARLFSNSARPGGVLSVEGSLSKDSKDVLKARIAEQQEGLHNQFKTLVLDQSAKWQSMAMTGVDSQHLETRRFQIEEVCRALRVFPQMVMHTDKTSTFASAEQFFLAHVTHSLMPWIVRWEQRLGMQVLGGDPELFAKFMVAALLRGDAVQRATFYEKALGGARGETAYMTRNEVRDLEELDPIEGGDVLPTPTPPTAPIGGPDERPQKPSVPAPIIVSPEGKLIWNNLEVGGLADLPFFKFNENHGDHGRFSSGPGGPAGTAARVSNAVASAKAFLADKSAKEAIAAVVASHAAKEALSFTLQSLLSHVSGLDASTWKLNEDLVEHSVMNFANIASLSVVQAKDILSSAVGKLISARQTQVDKRRTGKAASDEGGDDVLDILRALLTSLENLKPAKSP